MQATARPPAISGVSASAEASIMTVYPSIAGTTIGGLLGRLYESIPLRICGVKLSHLLFVLPTAPLAALIYFWLKVADVRYVLTNRGVQRWKALGNLRIGQVPLEEIADIQIQSRNGYAFYRAGDIHLLGQNGQQLSVLTAIPYPTIFRQTILEARDARLQVQSALNTIKARG